MKNMNPAINKFNRMFETFDSLGRTATEKERLQVLPIIFYGENLLKMYPQLNDDIDSSEVRSKLRSLRSYCNSNSIEITKLY